MNVDVSLGGRHDGVVVGVKGVGEWGGVHGQGFDRLMRKKRSEVCEKCDTCLILWGEITRDGWVG